jgi:hypothetical protein
MKSFIRGRPLSGQATAMIRVGASTLSAANATAPVPVATAATVHASRWRRDSELMVLSI